jgi:hypothetical protein
MAKSKTIRVTPNLQKCLKILNEVVDSMPVGDRKKRAKAALRYLFRTFKGERQPLKGAACPGATLIIKS